MAECEARMQPHGLVAYLTCDLDKSEHAGLNHHDGIYGIWWRACTLEDHEHAEDVIEQRRRFRASLRPGGGTSAAREGTD